MGATHDVIEANIPISNAYNQWTQCESLPQFMNGSRRCVNWTTSTWTGKCPSPTCLAHTTRKCTDTDDPCARRSFSGGRCVWLRPGRLVITAEIDLEHDAASPATG